MNDYAHLDRFKGKHYIGPVLTKQPPPWQHQVTGVTLIGSQRGTMLAYDMGTGKSRCVVDFVVNDKPTQRILIVCPLSVVAVWPRQFSQWAAGPVEIYAPDKGKVAEKAKQLRFLHTLNYSNNRKFVCVLNYESCWRQPMGDTLMKLDWDLVVLDESHRIKSFKGVASKFLARLGVQVRRRVCLTGTPMPHSPLDVFGQYRFLDRDIFGSSFTTFRLRYAIMGGYQGHEVKAYRDLDDLHRRFYSIAHKVSKRDVLDLPKATHEVIPVTLDDEALSIYMRFENDLIAEVGTGVVTASNALSKLLRLQQITSGYAAVKQDIDDESTTLEKIDDTKRGALQDLLEDLPPTEPVVVFARFRHDLDSIHEAAGEVDRPCQELSGRKNELAAWQAASGGGVLAVQIQSGGVGIDLTRACYCVYFSIGYSLGDYEQSLARVDRPGQTRPVTYYHLVAKGTVDEQVYEALKARKQVVEYVLERMNFQEVSA